MTLPTCRWLIWSAAGEAAPVAGVPTMNSWPTRCGSDMSARAASAQRVVRRPVRAAAARGAAGCAAARAVAGAPATAGDIGAAMASNAVVSASPTGRARRAARHRARRSGCMALSSGGDVVGAQQSTGRTDGNR